MSFRRRPRRGFEPAVALLLDVAAAWAAVVLARAMRFGWVTPAADLAQIESLMPILLLARLGSFYAAGIYRRSFLFPRGFDVADMIQAWASGTVILAAAVFFGRFLETSRLVLVYEAAANLALVGGWRILARLAARAVHPVRAAVVAGDESLARRVNHFLEAEGWEYRVVRTVPPGTIVASGGVYGTRSGAGATALGGERCAPVAGNGDAGDSGEIEAVFVRAADADADWLASSAGLRVFLVPDAREIMITGATPTDLGGLVILESGGVRRDRHYLAAKRALDVAVSLSGVIFLAPLMLLVAIAIRADSPGPVFFIQDRAGRKGRSFRIFKFRTMTHGLLGPALTEKGDRRVTRLGGLLRQWSLDELPQLFNVLFGTMSLVGPRPELPAIVASYPAWRRPVLDVEPGMTGLVQILGRDDLHEEEKARLDLYYAMNRSLEMDVSIILRTFRSVFRYRGRT
jgi:exopolysaccharide biosynthesis polyprenyl glycosylphosphotransferase